MSIIHTGSVIAKYTCYDHFPQLCISMNIFCTIRAITVCLTVGTTKATYNFSTWFSSIKTLQEEFPETGCLKPTQIPDVVSHSFAIFSYVAVVVLKCGRCRLSITACPSSFLKIFPNCMRRSHVNHAPYG